VKSKFLSIRTVRDENVCGKRVLVRVDFNVPLQHGTVADDLRIRAALPTVNYLLERRATVILCSHLGRPGGTVVESLRLKPIAKVLEEILGRPVQYLPDCVGPEVDRAIEQSVPGDILLLENTRFHSAEEENGHFFAAQLAKHCDLYVNDAFGSAHRAHASTEGVAHHVPAVAGLLLEHEFSVLALALKQPRRPLVAIFGGAKVGGKIGALDRLSEVADVILVAGGLGHTILAAHGIQTGDSLAEISQVKTADHIRQRAAGKLVLPVDAIVMDPNHPEAQPQHVAIDSVPTGWRIADIGPETVKLFQQRLQGARTVIWNGTLGICEDDRFSSGSRAVAETIVQLDALTLAGGGDTAAALRKFNLHERFTHISTGGGAFLQLLEGSPLPAVAALDPERAMAATG